MIEAIYQHFIENYPQPKTIEYCKCGCKDDFDIEQLLTTDLRQLDDILIELLPCFMSTVGDVDDFKAFLPRILEIITAEDLDSLTAKLQYAKFATWPEKEKELIQSYFEEWFTNLLNKESSQVYSPARGCSSQLSSSASQATTTTGPSSQL